MTLARTIEKNGGLKGQQQWVWGERREWGRAVKGRHLSEQLAEKMNNHA